MSSDQESFAIENHAWEQVDPILANVTAPKDGFFVSFHASTSQEHESSVFSFRVQRDMLISSPLVVSQLLSHTNIPIESQTKEFIQSISNLASNMSSTQHELIVTYRVGDDDDDDIIVEDNDCISDNDHDDSKMENNDYGDTDMEEYGSDDDDDEEEEEEEEEEKDGVQPASKESIEKLEKVRINEWLGSLEICSVCLDELEIGSEATRMPCLHVYHTDCIVEWLGKSNLCPLCRYEMPC